MREYCEKWEEYIQEHYVPGNMTREDLRELGEIADILKDISEYCGNGTHMSSMTKE